MLTYDPWVLGFVFPAWRDSGPLLQHGLSVLRTEEGAYGLPYCLCSTFCSGLMCDRSEGVGSRAAGPRIRSPGGGRGWGQLQKKSAKRAAKSCFARAQEVGEDIQAIFFRRRHQPRRPTLAKIRPGRKVHPPAIEGSVASLRLDDVARK